MGAERESCFVGKERSSHYSSCPPGTGRGRGVKWEQLLPSLRRWVCLKGQDRSLNLFYKYECKKTSRACRRNIREMSYCFTRVRLVWILRFNGPNKKKKVPPSDFCVNVVSNILWKEFLHNWVERDSEEQLLTAIVLPEKHGFLTIWII